MDFLLLLVSCLLCVVVWVGQFPEVCGGSVCPPGGQYFDKHVGRKACCSEICERRQSDCDKKCPNFEADKARESPLDPSSAKGPALPAILLPVAAVLLLLALLILGKWRGWGGVLRRPLTRNRLVQNEQEGGREEEGGGEFDQVWNQDPEYNQAGSQGGTPEVNRHLLNDLEQRVDGEEVAIDAVDQESTTGQSDLYPPSSHSDQTASLTSDFQTAKTDTPAVQVQDDCGTDEVLVNGVRFLPRRC